MNAPLTSAMPNEGSIDVSYAQWRLHWRQLRPMKAPLTSAMPNEGSIDVSNESHTASTVETAQYDTLTENQHLK